MPDTLKTPTPFLSTSQFLEQWQAHRRLTRKIIVAFPEDKLFSFSLGGMRSFGEMLGELLGMTITTVRGVSTDKWDGFVRRQFHTKEEVLHEWDLQTAHLEEEFPRIPQERFDALTTAFGQWTMPGRVMLQYAVDNEIHHRGEGYVYLRALGIEPPAFYDRD